MPVPARATKSSLAPSARRASLAMAPGPLERPVEIAEADVQGRERRRREVGGLHDCLLRYGYREQDIGFILDENKTRPPGSRRGDGQRWQDYFTPELEADIRRRERLLYRIGGYNHGESPCS